ARRQRNSPLRFSEKDCRPEGANTPAAVRVPRSAGAEKAAARQGRTRLRQFGHPAQPVLKKTATRTGAKSRRLLTVYPLYFPVRLDTIGL
ncbi:MAG: hypothetical protein SPJ24_05495, partial [Agathobaculum butyriciproducens]|nr:hypothetical protein [Agathobaculum butyriciproducens]